MAGQAGTPTCDAPCWLVQSYADCLNPMCSMLHEAHEDIAKEQLACLDALLAAFGQIGDHQLVAPTTALLQRLSLFVGREYIISVQAEAPAQGNTTYKPCSHHPKQSEVQDSLIGHDSRIRQVHSRILNERYTS